MNYYECKFISNGTWFDKGTEAKLTTYLDGTDSGLFTGIISEKSCNRLDGELCSLDEFWIYDKEGTLIREPVNEQN